MSGHDNDAILAVATTTAAPSARVQGGDGSPQLDLDAIEARRVTLWQNASGVLLGVLERDALVALVRRLQQENEELRAPERLVRVAADIAASGQWSLESATRSVLAASALRGRVEELTEALRALVTQPSQRGWDRARALLAGVVPEKETP